MKLIAQVKLQPAPGQTELLRRTLEVANAAANYVSEVAWETKTFRQYDLHHACYYAVRERYELSAQMTVRLLAKVADAYKLDRKTQRRFHPHGSIAYDNRILAWKLAAQTVSIWTVEGRQTIPFVAGERQLALLPFMQGEADLVYRRGEFYLHQVCEVDEPPVEDVDEFLGVDLGVVNIATDSDGTTYSGNVVNNVRHRHRRLRSKLQRKGTKSARRRLKKLAGKERRFATDVNHTVSKRIVAAAKDTGRGIALEDLRGIRERVTVRRAQRVTLHSWPFYQLRTFVEYKAKLAGVPVIAVDPRNTSRTCPVCGCTDKRNRPSQAVFSCIQCGFSGPADYIAAVNIGSRAVVNPPHVSDAPSAA
ncbi:MAG: transposase [Anaerolineae bacterium]|nr:MAG: transposase [Anaerolineae bacterium]